MLVAALAACTDRVPSATPGTTAKTVAHGTPSATPSGTSAARPGPSTTAPAASPSTPGPPDGTGSPAPSGPPAASPAPSTPAPGTATPTGPVDDGGEDARVFCSPTALSIAVRVLGDSARPGNPRHGAGPRSGGEAVLVVRNISGHTCVLHGTPTLTVLDDRGRAAPLASVPAQPFAKPFALHPGANGVARARFAAPGGCAAKGATARVTLPGSKAPVTVAVVDAHGRPATLPLCGPAPRTGPFKPGFA
ncbi:DUF4232 domain-containing protein [Streptomyces sp. NPDC048111]|uniref:DUF4232 domain-containing protein n=1 Tax=Streptomyces sp. NPDC048111 TaxID=3365500 RepID=UPI003716D2FE